AGAVGMPPGSVHHHVGSMHYYTSGPMGERPPNLAPKDEEQWMFSEYAVGMPHAPSQGIDTTRSMADELLSRMHAHFVGAGRCGPSLDGGAAEQCSAWAFDWCELVRWSWPDARKK